ncbi:TorF family putative porin [Sphingobium sufflavum]|uniref:TorF family putative porin n=1 Tax=Sphingobium sufflavum TaxID=1129547 RepID=UPI001F37138C|nr:TorF family putative porin [Sphingobium sufflavum]MCE7795330.1 TorF family putative porin [Sphingobium sufflavum]
MRKSILGLSAFALVALATPAMAQDDDGLGLTITGGGAVVSDYRFRGLSQSSEDFAVQGSFTVTHTSGFYAGVWGSSISFAQGTEIDLIGGFSKEIIPGLTGDVGFTYYVYPNKVAGLAANEIIEPYASVSGTVGPVWAKAGIAWAPKQDAYLFNGKRYDNTYLWADGSVGIPSTPLKATAHLGWTSNGALRGTVADAFSTQTKADIIDYSVGASATYKALTFGVNYVNTNVPKRFRNGGGTSLREGAGADGTVVFSVAAAF